MTKTGVLAPNGELNDFRWWQFSDGQFVDRGWSRPDGPGEWGWIEMPSDEYHQSVDVKTSSQTYVLGQPIMATLSNIVVPKGHRAVQSSLGRISLIHANRNREKTNLTLWGASLPRPNSLYSLSISESQIRDSSLVIDMTDFAIRGGWIPGHYHVSIRVQNCQKRSLGEYTSDISRPFQFTITE